MKASLKLQDYVQGRFTRWLLRQLVRALGKCSQDLTYSQLKRLTGKIDSIAIAAIRKPTDRGDILHLFSQVELIIQELEPLVPLVSRLREELNKARTY